MNGSRIYPFEFMFKNFYKVLECETNQIESTRQPTTEQGTEPTTSVGRTTTVEPTTQQPTYPTIPSYPFDLDAVIIGNFVPALINSYGLPIGSYVAEYGSQITVSGSCYPEYEWRGLDCANFTDFGCDFSFHNQIIGAEQIEDGSWVTMSHCPECGCATTGVPNFYDLAAEEGNRKPVDESALFEQLDELFYWAN